MIGAPHPLVHKYILSEPMRQAKDPEYVKFLSLIRTQQPTQEDIDAIFPPDKTIITEQQVISFCSTAVH
jgi:hypothetical protein